MMKFLSHRSVATVWSHCRLHSTACLSVLLVTSVLVGSPDATAVQDDASGQQVDELFVFPPDTPPRLIRAAVLAKGIERPALARGYLRDVLDRQLSAAERLQLRDDFGIGVFLDLNADPELQPEAGELLAQINQAVTESMPSDADLTTLVNDLDGPRAQVVKASLKLLAAGNRAVPALLAAEPDSRSGLVADALLTKYVRQFRYGLLQQLATADESTQLRILNLLASSADPVLALPLLRYQFAAESVAVSEAAGRAVARLRTENQIPASADEATTLLAESAKQLLSTAARRFPATTDGQQDDRLSILFGAESVDNSEPYGTFLVRLAEQLGADATAIDPDSLAAAAIHLAAAAAADSWPPAWPDSITLPDSAAANSLNDSAAELAVALQLALQTRNPAAVLGLLNQAELQSLLLTSRTDLLAEVLAAADPRIRLLAAGIVTAGQSSSPGTSLADEILLSAANGSSKPEAVVMDSRPSEAQSVAAVLEDLGFASRAAITGQRGFEAAVGQLHTSLILIHSNVARWDLTPTLANLRADARTRLSPIVVYGPPRDAISVASARSQYAGVWFVEEPLSAASLEVSLAAREVAGPLLTEAERQAMIEFATGLIAARTAAAGSPR